VIRPLWVEVQAFRGWRARTRLPLDRRVTVIVAENRRGKSSALNAVEWCLFGARVEKKDSGLDERADWEVRPRGAGEEPTEATLALATAEGEVRVCRRRTAGARAGKGDELGVTLTDGATVTGADAERWLAAHGLGDWEDYRRAHCFHQEAARRRVLDRGDRSAVLAALLGLDEDRALRETLGELRAAALVKGVDTELDELDRDLQKAALRPQQRLLALEQRLLTDRGLQRWQLGPALEAEVISRLLERARRLAAGLGLVVPLPDPGDVDALVRWADDWPRSVRASATVLATLPGLRQRQGALAGAIPLAVPAEGHWRAAEAARSAAREAAVNATLGVYFAAIKGDPSARGLRVHVHRTPKGLDYQLRDASGEAAVPVMNQADINALSLAALFAQAEDAAARGGLAWVVLDDPVQSLDAAHQQGLADAVGRLAARCHVLVGVVPSGLVERLRTHVPAERRFLHLAPWQEATGSQVEREEVL
jgi:hypothetical protein